MKYILDINSMVYQKIISNARHSFGADLNIKSKAKDLRKNMTSHERILWYFLRKRKLNGIHFRRQHPYGIYILDFYCFEKQLVIEIDGMIHLKNIEYDEERTAYLESSGLKVIRFKNEDVEERIEWVLKQISTYLTNLPSL
jgi:very-short-patch-repair endonuclease